MRSDKNAISPPQSIIKLKDVYHRYLGVMEFERQKVCTTHRPGRNRDELLDCYRPVPFEHFEAAIAKKGKLSTYLMHLDRAEIAMRSSDFLS